MTYMFEALRSDPATGTASRRVVGRPAAQLVEATREYGAMLGHITGHLPEEGDYLWVVNFFRLFPPSHFSSGALGAGGALPCPIARPPCPRLLSPPTHHRWCPRPLAAVSRDRHQPLALRHAPAVLDSE